MPIPGLNADLKTMPFTYLIALGSNLGDRRQYLAQAIESIRLRIGRITATAKFYETEPLGAANQAFLNSALLLESDRKPAEVLTLLLKIEGALGRQRTVHWGNRTIDLDIIMVRDNALGQQLNLKTSSLTIPHPHCLQRSFVLQPACDIAADWLHPNSGQCLAQHLQWLSEDKKKEALSPQNS